MILKKIFWDLTRFNDLKKIYWDLTRFGDLKNVTIDNQQAVFVQGDWLHSVRRIPLLSRGNHRPSKKKHLIPSMVFNWEAREQNGAWAECKLTPFVLW